MLGCPAAAALHSKSRSLTLTGEVVLLVLRLQLRLAPGQWTQLLNPLADRSVRNGWARIVRKAGSSPWVAYGVINDGGAPGQRTGDGAFLLMTVP